MDDIKKVKRLYESLGVPKEYFNPFECPFGEVKLNVIVSERKTAKTTNLLLLGLCAYWVDGTVLHYVRTRDEMIQNKNILDMYSVIVENGYIARMTKGKYNNVLYKARRWYLCLTGENGEVIETDVNNCTFCMSNDKADVYKSSYTNPKGDLIFYDEFISINAPYRQGDFMAFFNNIDTVVRHRNSAYVFMCANTLDRESQYFYELEIKDIIDVLQIGDHTTIKTDGGMEIYVSLLKGLGFNENNKEHNRLYFGLKSKLLSSISGGWSTFNYPHIESGERDVLGMCYLIINGNLLRLDVVRRDSGVWVEVHRATKKPDWAIVFTDEPPNNCYEFYGLGGKLGKKIFDYYFLRRFKYADNTCGLLVKKYMEKIRGCG